MELLPETVLPAGFDLFRETACVSSGLAASSVGAGVPQEPAGGVGRIDVRSIWERGGFPPRFTTRLHVRALGGRPSSAAPPPPEWVRARGFRPLRPPGPRPLASLTCPTVWSLAGHCLVLPAAPSTRRRVRSDVAEENMYPLYVFILRLKSSDELSSAQA